LYIYNTIIMTSLNFDDDGQLGSMELYGLKLQKVVADFTEFDAITKKYVDEKVSQAKSELTGGASEALDTFKELEDYLTASGTAGGLVEQISALSQQITDEATRAGTEEGKLDARVSALENNTTNATNISGLQSELDTTQQGAGLDLDGSYVADAARNYITGATSLKSADALLDSAVKAEADRATAAEEKLTADLSTQISTYTSNKTTTDSNITTLQSAVADEIKDRTDADNDLSGRISTLEADPTTQTEVNSVGSLLNALTASVTAGEAALTAAISTEVADRVAGDASLQADIGAETTRAEGAEDALRLDLDGEIATRDVEKITADDDRAGIRADLITTASALETQVATERGRAENAEALLNTGIATNTSNLAAQVSKQASEKATADTDRASIRTEFANADSALDERVAVFEGQLNNGNVEGSEYYVDNLSVQGVVDDLRGAIDYVNGERFTDKGIADSRHLSSEAKHTASDGRHAGHDTKHASHEENLEELENTKFSKAGGEITGEVRVNLDDSYFYLSSVWRIRTDAVGKRIVFEFNKGTEEAPDFVSGIPFISSH